LKPNEIWDLELWEYNAFMSTTQELQKQDIANAILTGHYTAYYINAGKKAKNPNELISEMYKKKAAKQSVNEGLRDIERLRQLEKLR